MVQNERGPIVGGVGKVPDDLRKSLGSAPPTVPCRFLYDDLGSQIYYEITQLPEYTPYRSELGLLQAQGPDIESCIPENVMMVELGCGDATKTQHLLRALLAIRSSVHYVGIDVSAEALRQTAATLQDSLPGLDISLVEADYLEGVRRVRREHPDAALCLLWLGSSIGNFPHGDAVSYVASLGAAAGENSRLLLGVDGWKDPSLLHAAYCDAAGVTERFIINGVRNVLRTVGHPDARDEDLWSYHVRVNRDLEQVEMSVSPIRAVYDIIPGFSLKPGQRLLMEISRKFSETSVRSLAEGAGYAVEVRVCDG